MFLLVISVNLTVHGKDHTNTIFKVSLSIQLARKSTQSCCHNFSEQLTLQITLPRTEMSIITRLEPVVNRIAIVVNSGSKVCTRVCSDEFSVNSKIGNVLCICVITVLYAYRVWVSSVEPVLCTVRIRSYYMDIDDTWYSRNSV